MRTGYTQLLAVLVASFATAATAEPLARDAVPEPLAPWVDWVLRGHEEKACPVLEGAGNRHVCVWPSQLDLEFGQRQGAFTQRWLLHSEASVPLPGDGRRWPQKVSANGVPVPVVAQGGRPSVRLAPGQHTLRGTFLWDALPELLQVPPETGIVQLRLFGEVVPFPKRDAKGRLWLQKRADGDAAGGEQRLEVKVHRRLADDVPLRLETRLELNVAGRSREVVLGRALPDGFVPLSLSSPLPARLDPDGRLRVQVRPGRWQLALVARDTARAEAIALPEPGGTWDSSEEWVFEARPQLRLVTLEDGVSVDPSQTTLPQEWRNLPAYQMEPGRALRLVEKRRGDSDPAPDQLSLSRVLWLDFDGGGYTVTDNVVGVVRRSTRLEMAPGTELGRVAVGGRDQVITRLEGSPLTGVELPQGQLQLAADSRIAAGATLSAVGWAHDFQSLDGRLHLPPGWRLVHAAGVDRAATTWIERWTLLDLFAVLILAAAFFRLWGPRWGALALVALALTWTESGAPHWAWATVLAGEALLRVLSPGRFPRFALGARLVRGAALVVLVLLAIPFAVAQVRAGLSPTLEQPYRAVETATVSDAQMANRGLEPAAPLEMKRDASEVRAKRASESFVGGLSSSLEYESGRGGYEPDPTARITTGPGLPAWQWTSVRLEWSGPVQRQQQLRLLLLPPFGNRVLAFVRVALLAVLLLCVIGAASGGSGGWLRRFSHAGATAALLAFALGAPQAAHADIPSQELLDELRQRLLEQPECRPSCAASSRLSLDVTPDALRARIQVDVQGQTAVPLPGGARSWSPERVAIDGEPATGLLRSSDGTLWVQLAPGRHQLVVEGTLPDRDSVELPLPLLPRRVEVAASGWTVHGVHEDGVAEANLQLSRIRAASAAEAERAVEPGELPPFVSVVRHLQLGLEWRTHTTVLRQSPANTALLLEVPLLEGESITTAGIRAENGSALVSMAPGVTRIVWASLLTQAPALSLKAPEDAALAEEWRLDVSPVWHVTAEGIPPVHQASPQGARIRTWRPWPGEELALAVARPAGVEGATATIDASELELAPGLRATDANLTVRLRSSRGGPHPITLPEGAELQRVSIDGAVQPIRQEGREVRIPLRPGQQNLELVWREPRGARTPIFRGSEVDLGMPSVNARIAVKPSPGRWTLSLGGPPLGPAVMFWPLLAVFAALAYALGRFCAATQWTPLRFHHWLLLSIGLTQVPVPLAALVVAWLLALGWRARHGLEVPGLWFDLVQVLLAGFSLLALMILSFAIQQGLLGQPEMQIAGNGSHAGYLRWYQDRAAARLPQPWLLSVPLFVYRLAMLAWALWLALSLVRWLRWAWACFSEGELWRARRRVAASPDAGA
jgi:hypothetical protein